MTVIEWLLDADPAIRWQVMRDLADATATEVAAERARVAVEGWGAQLLALQGPDGQWDGGTYRPGWVDGSKPFFDAWTATTFSLQLLRDLGVVPNDPAVRRAIALVGDNARWEATDTPFFEGGIGAVHQRDGARDRRVADLHTRRVKGENYQLTCSDARLRNSGTGRQHSSSADIASRRPGSRRSSVVSATSASRRANGAPRQ